MDGDVIIAQPLSSTLLTAILVCVVLALITFLSLASFNRKETVTGYLKPDIGLAKVMSPRSGVIQQVFIEDGQQVQAGERLALLRMPDQLAMGDSLSSTLQQGIEQQIALVSQRREQVITQFSQQASEYQSRLLLSQSLLQDLQAQQQLLQERLALCLQRQQDFSGLQQRGAISATE